MESRLFPSLLPLLNPAAGFFFTSQVAGMTEPVIEILLMAVAGAAG
jgi:hypothetical protein